jgi:hypothetical protein
MSAIRIIARGGCLIALSVLLAGCIIAPPDGGYDRDHHRYYQDHRWHQCGDRDDRDDRGDGRCRR